MEKYYSDAEIVEMLERAGRMGHSLSAGSPLEKITLQELDDLVNERKAN